MRAKNYAIILVVACCLLAGCAPKTVTKAERFPKMYEERPRSILVLPPMNESTAADAKEYYITTIQEPLSFNGFYVYSIPVVAELMKMEGVYDTELLYGLPLNKFQEYFGAEAVLFTRIKAWDTCYYVIGSHMTVSFESELRSTKTNEVLWKYTGTQVVNLSGNSGNILASIIATAINTAIADYVPYARQVNYQIFSTMPAGPYSPVYLKDQKVQFFDQDALNEPEAESKASAENSTE